MKTVIHKFDEMLLIEKQKDLQENGLNYVEF